MTKRPEIEREEIRDGMNAADAATVRALREVLLALSHDKTVPQASLDKLAAIETDVRALRARKASLEGKPAPDEPDILPEKGAALEDGKALSER